jgi:phosphatidylglycerol---prolipoprotein diacylglyceryl transferase
MSAGVITIDVNPVLIHVGGLSIHWYGVMYVVGIGVALLVVLRYLEARGISRDRALEIFFPIVLAGLIGGRLYYVIQSNLGYYLQHPLKIIATWEGGMAFFGAIFGVFLMILYLSWRRHLPFWTLLDAGAIFAPLGQAFGRIGNIINGDIVGFQSNCAWCTKYVNPNSFPARHDIAYQPAAAYELLISLAIFAVVFSLRFRLRRAGMLFGLYLTLYSVSQFFIFFIRTEPVVAFGLKQAQLTAIITFAVGLGLMIYLSRHGPAVEHRGGAELLPTVGTASAVETS